MDKKIFDPTANNTRLWQLVHPEFGHADRYNFSKIEQQIRIPVFQHWAGALPEIAINHDGEAYAEETDKGVRFHLTLPIKHNKI